MADEYITDPEILAKLNGSGQSEYITDPALLAQLGGAPQAQSTPSLAPQAVSMGARVAGEIPAAAGAISNAARTVGSNVVGAIGSRPILQTAADVAGVMSHGVPWGTVARTALDPNATTVKQGLATAANMIGQGAGSLATGARNVGGALIRGAVAPESLLMAPYQMAAYEQEKIRQNPNAPGLQYNPYAQTVRGEYATQGQAGAANTRRAVINSPFGNVTPEQRAILEQDRQEKMRRMMQMEAARRVTGPVAPQ